jgi:hypothetical protein
MGETNLSFSMRINFALNVFNSKFQKRFVDVNSKF